MRLGHAAARRARDVRGPALPDLEQPRHEPRPRRPHRPRRRALLRRGDPALRRPAADARAAAVGPHGPGPRARPGGESVTSQPIDTITSSESLQLSQLVDRTSLEELIRSLRQLTGVSLRLLGPDGALLVDASDEVPFYRHLDTAPGGRAAVGREVAHVKRLLPEATSEGFTGPTGASFRVVSIEYDHRRLGRVIIGPFRTEGPAPAALGALDPALDEATTRALFARLPALAPERAGQLESHLRSSLELILFAGHKALVTSQMHLASVGASYHELQDRNTRLQQAYDRLRELDRLKSNFLATVSHELRTPLTSIIGYSEMLSEGIAGPLGEEQLEFVQTIHEKGEQLLQLIKNLLDLSKLESGTLSVRRASMDLEVVLKQVVSTLLPAARKKGVTLEVKAPADLPAVLGDPERLRQVFLNLTENALKFTPTGGLIRLAADLAPPSGEDDAGFALLAPASDRVEVHVADSGIGIPEAERSKVFDAFYQVDSSSTREVGGTGLGLSIVKRLVEAHEGTIHIEGNQPRGTTVVVTLPTAS
ncbi:MAG: histidine kinase [Myxococcales bacterium]|nr:MAG: histidine kinase [Myxococcales bacterium]